ncbi:MAG TPA: hypothetical protein VIL44_07730 [Micromonospora sp.]
MPASVVFEQHYDRLVRIAYLVGPRVRNETTRLVRAHRTVQRCLPLRSRATLTYPELVARVVRRAARPRRWALPALVPWARPTPLAGDRGHRILSIVLATTPAPVRAAYVLLNVEKMTARDTVLTLHAAGWRAGVAHVAAATALRQRLVEEYGIDVDEQRALLTEEPTDPTLARLRAPRPDALRLWRVARWGSAAVAASLAATVAAVPWLDPAGAEPASEAIGAWVTPEPTPVTVRRVSARAWRTTSEPSLASWPTRGSLANDEQLIDQAVTAWQDVARQAPTPTPAAPSTLTTASRQLTTLASGNGLAVSVSGGATPQPPVGSPQLLYAGDIDGISVAVLADPTRIATYTVAGHKRALVIAPAPTHGVDRASVLRLSLTPNQARYLVAPWVNRVDVRTADGRSWRSLTVSGGITAPVSVSTSEDCWAGPLLRIWSSEVDDGSPFVLADLGGTALVDLRYVPPSLTAATAATRAPGSAELATLSRLRCAIGELRDSAPESVTAWEVWSGGLPVGLGPSQVVCLRAELPDGRSHVAAVLTRIGGGTGSTVAAATDSPLCSRRTPAVVIAWWWRSTTDSWYHIAVGSTGVGTVEVSVDGVTHRGAGFLVAGPFPRRPTGSVTTRATDWSGRSVPVLG